MSTSLLVPDDIRAALRPKAQPRLLLANVRAVLELSLNDGQCKYPARMWRTLTGLSDADLRQWIGYAWHGGSSGDNKQHQILLCLPDMQRRAQQRAKDRDRMRAKRARQKTT